MAQIPSAQQPFVVDGPATDDRGQSSGMLITPSWFRFLSDLADGAGGGDVVDTLTVTNNVVSIDGIATVGRFGVPVIVAYGRTVGAIAAVASVATYTVDAADGTFEVSANVLVTTAVNHNFNVDVAYTDEGGTARILVLTFSLVGGGIGVLGVIQANGAVPYHGAPLHIRAKAATTITFSTVGAFATVVYNVEGVIKQIA